MLKIIATERNTKNIFYFQFRKINWFNAPIVYKKNALGISNNFIFNQSH
jgi:hypothetical protein